MRSDCDVIVVGAGIAGAGVAAELSEDRRVVLLEQEAHPGLHATGRSAALHTEIYGNACIRALTRASRDVFRQGEDGRPFATERGCLYVATVGQIGELEAFAAQPTVAPATTWIDGAAARDLVPVLIPDRVAAGLIEKHAYDLDVDAIHRFFLKRLRGNGGLLRCLAPVTAAAFDGQAWTVVAGDAEYRGAVLVNAAGAWGDPVARLAGAQPVGLQPRRRTALIVAPPAGVDLARWPMVVDIAERFYFKPEAGNILLSPADETPVEPHDAYADEMGIAVAVDRVQQVADIPVRRVEHSWAGLRTFAPDKTPVVGYDTALPGFFWLVGQGGYGIQTSPALSRLAAALVRGQGIPDDLAARRITEAELSPARFQARD
jgi:D-arginine dehydrogenase